MNNPPAWVLELLPKCDCYVSRFPLPHASHADGCLLERHPEMLDFLARVLASHDIAIDIIDCAFVEPEAIELARWVESGLADRQGSES